jgi:hypothetical protein
LRALRGIALLADILWFVDPLRQLSTRERRISATARSILLLGHFF